MTIGSIGDSDVTVTFPDDIAEGIQNPELISSCWFKGIFDNSAIEGVEMPICDISIISGAG